MDERFDHLSVERKWQERWQVAGCFKWRNDPERQKMYLLEMFPYTSGRLHIGHARNYSMGDALARMYRARGFDVLYPMGWDAFGLPAENAAIVKGVHPKAFTESAMQSMKSAMHRLGLSYDWTREIATSAPSYTRAQQQLFIQFFEKGLVYRDTTYVNWCPQCATVLANEQVIAGRCWRCDSEVVKRQVAQWFFDIRKYADELLDRLDRLDGWPDSVKNIQRAWIGRSHGTDVVFRVDGRELLVFTTRVDTLFGCTFVVLAPEHPWLATQALDPEVRLFREETLLKSTEERAHDEKRGIFTGRYAINPVNGERVPIWIANYVLIEYGTGAIMAVPAHDQRDFEFATKYDLPVRRVILGPDGPRAATLPYEGPGLLTNSGQYDGLDTATAAEHIAAALEREAVGRRSTRYRLQNWSVSRQRYWGNPIPIVYCETHGAQPVPLEQLPVLLPEVLDFQGTGSPLSRSAAFMHTTCPRCGSAAQRDPDTMDTFVDSAWYFLRFPTPDAAEPFDSAVVNRLLPVDTYIGGIEHATLHLMYARFFVKALRDLGMLSFDEPFVRLYNQGMVNDALGRKQSKSLGNVVEPFDVADTYGADSLRLYLLFTTAYNFSLNWNDSGPRDAQAFLQRVWRLGLRWESALASHEDDALELARCRTRAARELCVEVHQAIAKVTADTERFHFNTAIAALMHLTNVLYACEAGNEPAAAAGGFRTLVRLLSIFAPHFCEEIWSQTGGLDLLAARPWPVFDPNAAAGVSTTIAVQVNGRFIGTVEIESGHGQQTVVDAAQAHEAVRQHLQGKPIKKTVYVQDRLVNFVV